MDPKDGITFSGSGMVEEVYDYIRNVLPEGSHILELGSGHVSTQVLTRTYRMTSIEDDSGFIGLYPSRYIHAPQNPANGNWYDVGIVEAGLKDLDPYQMIIVDGPPHRAGFYENKHLFNLDVWIVIDDVWREAEMKMAQTLARDLGREVDYVFPFQGSYQTAIIKPKMA